MGRGTTARIVPMALPSVKERRCPQMRPPAPLAASCVSLCLIAGLLLVTDASAGSEPPLARLWGTDFAGGAATLYGSFQNGVARTNYVYAAPSGERAIMAARFTLTALPTGPLLLHLRARGDDGHTNCPIRISLNGTVLMEGPNGFAPDRWEWQTLPLPPDALRVGDNELTVANLAPEGQVGMPPWFMLAAAVIGGPDCERASGPTITEDFRVHLPAEKRPFPEPLTAGRPEPGFKIRGIKGWCWRPEQYLAEIPVLAQYRLNFLMNCYGSMYDIEHYSFGDPRANRWWEPLPEVKRRAYEAVVRACQEHGIDFCFSLNPNLATSRLMNYGSPEDLELLWQHYDWMQGLGVKWFNLQFDDISAGIDAGGQARVANAILERLRQRDPEAQMVLCPTYYWGTGEEPQARTYLEELGRELHPDAYIFWTGPAVVTPNITRRAAEQYRALVGHRLIIWDNYPVNDGGPTLHLGPVMGRDPDLCEVCDGYMSNPLCPQNQANRIPLLTIADYAYNPWDYDPARSIGQAILHLGETDAQREVLRDLVEMYPGMLLFREGTWFNPLRERFFQLLAGPHSRWLATAVVAHVQDVVRRMQDCFGDRFSDARQILERDLRTMEEALAASYDP